MTTAPAPFTPLLRRRTRLLAGLFFVSLLTIVYFANLISYEHHARWDVTATREHTLDPRTVAALERVEQLLRQDDLQITAIMCFAPQAATRPGEGVMVSRLMRRCRDTLEKFAEECQTGFNVLSYDPFQNKADMEKLVQRFGGVDLVDTVVVRCHPKTKPKDGEASVDRYEFVKRHQLADFNFRARRLTRWKGETTLLQAIQQVAGERQPTFSLTSGAGEAPLSNLTALSALFAPGNIRLQTLAPTAPIPTGSDSLLIVAAPRGDLSAARAASLERYLVGGGRALVIVPPTGVARPRLNAVLERLGATLPGKLVVADRSTQFLVKHRGTDHPITTDLPPGQRVTLRTVQAIEPVEAMPPLHEFVPLVTSGKEASWGHVPDRRGQQQLSKEPPYHLAAALTWPARDDRGESLGGRTGRMVIIGTASVLENDSLRRAGIANRTLVYNSAMWLIDRDGKGELLGTTHTGRESGQIQLDDGQKSQLMLLLVLTPTCAFFAGILVWLFRKD